MADISSETQDLSPKVKSTSSEASTRFLLGEDIFSEDSDLRSIIEENAFQVLSQGSLIKSPGYTVCVSELDKGNDFISQTFPRKLWKIVESDQFKCISWNEDGTCIVIHEELFKKEILERKDPYRIFKAESIKSLVRQLNLYGFSKIRQNFQRSAFLADFLEEEKEVPIVSKLKVYCNPNFRRGYPQLLVKMKRRIGIRNASLVSTLFNKKHFRAGADTDNHNSGLIAETSGEGSFSTSTNLNMPLIRKPSVSQRIASLPDTTRSGFPPTPSSTSFRPTECIATNQNAILNQLASIHMQSHSTYIQANDHTFNCITTTPSQYQIISSSQNSLLELIVKPSTFPSRYPEVSINETPYPNLLPAGNMWLLGPMTADISVDSPFKPAFQLSSLGK
ncbi:heat shock transcription factor, Y-linked-like [Saimiri boliviensis]|uniref:heat shock transcription factor, Y-linked-like n=1 Tax=Saimiri boliviensis TaxID=27679 RepID=UPI003D781E36